MLHSPSVPRAANRTAGVPLKPKILITTFAFPPANNGVSNAAFVHARIMQELGCEVEVITHGETFSHDAQQGLSVVCFPVSGKGHLLSPHRGSLKELNAFLGRTRWDIVFMHCWQAWNTNCLLDFFSGAERSDKLVLVSHGISTDSHSYPFPLNWLRRFLWWPYRTFSVPKYMRLIDRLVVLWDHYDEDRFLDNKIACRMSIPVSVIPNVARFDSTSLSRPDLKFTDEQLEDGFILSVGNYSEEKNELLVLEAYKRSRMTHVPLVFVGHQLNNYSAKLEKHSDQWNLHNVQFCERLTKQQIDWLYMHALMFLCGSKTECQPLVVLDSLASGTACISTDVGCVRSLGCVLIVDKVESMADGIRSLLKDSAKRKELVSQGLELSQKEFSLSSTRNKWGHLLNQLMSRCA